MAFSPPSRGRLSCTSRLDASSTRGGGRSVFSPRAARTKSGSFGCSDDARTTTREGEDDDDDDFRNVFVLLSAIDFDDDDDFKTEAHPVLLRLDRKTFDVDEEHDGALGVANILSLSLSLVCVCVCIVYQREKKTEENKESDFFVRFGFLGTGGRGERYV